MMKNLILFCLINNDLLIFADYNDIYPITLKKHNKKNKIKLEEGGQVYKIFSLNEKQFIVAQEERINLFELKEEYKFNLISNIKLNNYAIARYPKNRFIFAEDKFNKNKKFYLYG